MKLRIQEIDLTKSENIDLGLNYKEKSSVIKIENSKNKFNKIDLQSTYKNDNTSQLAVTFESNLIHDIIHLLQP